MLSICRICLQEVNINDTTDLFAIDEHSKEVLNKIYLCFQLILECKYYLPRNICTTCKQELEVANNFRLKCIKFEEKFTTLCELIRKNGISQLYTDETNENIEETHTESSGDTFKNNDETNNQEVAEIMTENNSEEDSNLNVCKRTSFKCSICNKILKTEVSLRKHNISLHEKRKRVGEVSGFGATRRYHCTKCSYSTPHSQTLVHHMRRHDGEKPYHCECGKSFTQPSGLAAHRKTHSDTAYHVCAICGKQFKHTFSLSKHQSVHEGGKFPCEVCHKVLKSREALQNHMLRHYNIRNYNCEDCGETFVTTSELNNHRKMHNSERSVECHVCGYKTHTKRILVVHLKRHSGDKAFKCQLCSRTFCTSSDLARHQRVHTRAKPFPCPTCAQRFTHSTSLNKHMLNTHGIHYKWADLKLHENRKVKPTIKDDNPKLSCGGKPFPCSMCSQRFMHSSRLHKHMLNVHGTHI